jgi:hypothetical protein
MASLKTLINLGLVAELVKQIASDEYATHPLGEGWSYDWPTGTGAGQANSSYHATGSATGGGDPVTLDLRGGGLTDAFGDAIAFTSVRALFVRNTGSADLVIGGTLSGINVTDAQEGPKLNAGGALVLISADGWTVSAGGSDTLTITAPEETCTYEVVIIGTR